jgi:hypothetical protein
MSEIPNLVTKYFYLLQYIFITYLNVVHEDENFRKQKYLLYSQPATTTMQNNLALGCDGSNCFVLCVQSWNPVLPYTGIYRLLLSVYVFLVSNRWVFFCCILKHIVNYTILFYEYNSLCAIEVHFERNCENAPEVFLIVVP